MLLSTLLSICCTSAWVMPKPCSQVFSPASSFWSLVGVLRQQAGQPGHADDAGDHQPDDDRVHPEDQHQRGQPAGGAAANHHAAQRVNGDHQHERQEDRAEDVRHGVHAGGDDHPRGQAEDDDQPAGQAVAGARRATVLRSATRHGR